MRDGTLKVCLLHGVNLNRFKKIVRCFAALLSLPLIRIWIKSLHSVHEFILFSFSLRWMQTCKFWVSKYIDMVVFGFVKVGCLQNNSLGVLTGNEWKMGCVWL